MHSAISYAKQHTPIYTPSGWDIVIRLARRGKCYVVIPIKHTSIYNFKKLASSYIRNTKTDTDGNRVKWMQIRCAQVTKGLDDTMLFKYNLNDESFRVLRLIGSSRRGRPTPPKFLPRLYGGKLPVSEAKKRDLLSLCSSAVIPEEHHDFYRRLQSSSTASDKLPEPDVKDTDGDTD